MIRDNKHNDVGIQHKYVVSQMIMLNVDIIDLQDAYFSRHTIIYMPGPIGLPCPQRWLDLASILPPKLVPNFFCPSFKSWPVFKYNLTSKASNLE